MGQKQSRESFNFAHTSFMISNPKTWHRVTIGVVTALVLVLILLIILVVIFVVVRPQSFGTGPQSDTGNPNQNIQRGSMSGCFPPEATVLTTSGRKKLDQLLIGDMVLDLDDDGKLGYTKVFAWFRKSSQSGMFLQLITENGAKITLTRNHLIHRFSMENGSEIVLASEIHLGDFVFTSNSFNYSKIMSITPTTYEGLYAPVTLSGTMFVDQVLVSCYTDYWVNGLVGHKFIHTVGLSPLRFLWHLYDDERSWIFKPIENENLWLVQFWKFVNHILKNLIAS